MYELVLSLHSWLRWGALLAGVLATGAAFTSRPGTARSPVDRWGLIFVTALDLQLVLGFLLYFALSPTTAAIFNDFGAAMRDPVARFWAVEHLTAMLVAIILTHMGRILARKAQTPEAGRIRLLVCFGLATLLIIFMTPWPGMRAGRPLFRL